MKVIETYMKKFELYAIVKIGEGETSNDLRKMFKQKNHE